MKPEFEKTMAALEVLYRKVDPDQVPWILTGSTSLILQGVDVAVKNDIDILANADDCLRIAVFLEDYLISPPKGISETGKYRSNYSTYDINGVNLELMGDFQYKLDNGLWSEVKSMDDYEILECNGMKLRVLSLGEELKEYQAMGREDKVEAILKKLAGFG